MSSASSATVMPPRQSRAARDSSSSSTSSSSASPATVAPGSQAPVTHQSRTTRTRLPPGSYVVEHLSIDSDSDDVYLAGDGASSSEDDALSSEDDALVSEDDAYDSDSSSSYLVDMQTTVLQRKPKQNKEHRSNFDPSRPVPKKKKKDHTPEQTYPLAVNASGNASDTADVLRYTFAGNNSLSPPGLCNVTRADTTKTQIEKWNAALYRLCMNTLYNSKNVSLSGTGFGLNSHCKANILWKVFTKDELTKFLVGALASDTTLNDDLSELDSDDSYVSNSNDYSVSDGDDCSTSNSDDSFISDSDDSSISDNNNCSRSNNDNCSKSNSNNYSTSGSNNCSMSNVRIN